METVTTVTAEADVTSLYFAIVTTILIPHYGEFCFAYFAVIQHI